MEYSLAFSKGANANELNVSQPPSSERKSVQFFAVVSFTETKI